MAEKDKKYYWLRLRKDFFKRHDIKILQAGPDGTATVLFYLRLLCESVDHDGRLRFSDDIPYTPEMLAAVTDTDEAVVENAIRKLCALKLMEQEPDGTYIMTKLEGLIGAETYWAQKARERRSKEDNVGQCTTNVQQCTTEVQPVYNASTTCTGKRIDIDKDKDIKKDNTPARDPKHKHGEYNNVLLTDAELDKLKSECPNVDKYIEDLSAYMASTGKAYKSHFATLRNWIRKDGGKRIANEARPSYAQFEAHEYSAADFAELERRLLQEGGG